jgi:hypothetical protein
MSGSAWDDDDSWWHQQDLELQQREEAERIDRCNRALAELDAINDELTKHRSIQ